MTEINKKEMQKYFIIKQKKGKKTDLKICMKISFFKGTNSVSLFLGLEPS